ncbi:MAG: histidine phosphatase family protein [Patescibacteria group bacterium]|nr:histidine phosphatase family protein [Patescibacteria group bacterium]
MAKTNPNITTIYFVRHAKTNNPHRIVKGWLPGFKLTSIGKKEVARLANYLRNKPIKYIFCSPLLRAKQTAQVIHKSLPNAKLIPDKRLIEWLTAWQGKTIKQVQADPKMQWSVYYSNPLKFWTGQGQTAQQIVKNLLSFTKMTIKKYPNQEIVAVSHGDPIKLLRCYLETGKISKKFVGYKCSQPSITAFIFNNGKYKKTLYKSYIKNQPYFTQ